MELNPGQIYLADQRGLIENASVQKHCTFNFERYQNEHREPSSALFLFNDEFIAGGKLNFFLAKENSIQIFLPITGGLDILAKEEEYAVETGQIQVFMVEKGEVLEISNPYPKDTVNYLQIGFKTEAFFFKQKEPFNFNFDEKPNTLIDVVASYKLPFFLSTGRFSGRTEINYSVKDNTNRIFAFVIDGAFEIEGRLLHARDGLALWECNEIELEALSNNAIVVVIEHP